jgi:hypothetical protein
MKSKYTSKEYKLKFLMRYFGKNVIIKGNGKRKRSIETLLPAIEKNPDLIEELSVELTPISKVKIKTWVEMFNGNEKKALDLYNHVQAGGDVSFSHEDADFLTDNLIAFPYFGISPFEQHKLKWINFK